MKMFKVVRVLHGNRVSASCDTKVVNDASRVRYLEGVFVGPKPEYDESFLFGFAKLEDAEHFQNYMVYNSGFADKFEIWECEGQDILKRMEGVRRTSDFKTFWHWISTRREAHKKIDFKESPAFIMGMSHAPGTIGAKKIKLVKKVS